MDFGDIRSKIQAYPIAVGALAVSIVCAGILYVRTPLVAKLETQVSELQGEWSRMERNRLRANNLEEHLRYGRELEQQVGQRLMAASEIAINYDYFFRIESQTGIKILNITQGGETTKAPALHLTDFDEYTVIPFNLTIQGDFEQTLRFLRAVEHGDYFARIDSVSYRRDEKAATTSIVSTLKILVLGRKS